MGGGGRGGGTIIGGWRGTIIGGWRGTIIGGWRGNYNGWAEVEGEGEI